MLFLRINGINRRKGHKTYIMDKDDFKELINDDEKGIARIIASYGRVLLKVVRKRVGNDDELAKDVMQDLYEDIFRNRKEIAMKDDPYVWIMVMAKNKANAALRKEHRSSKAPIEEGLSHSSMDKADQDLHYNETMDELLQQASQLTEKESLVLKASVVDGLGNKEIQEKFGLTDKATRNVKYSALKKLRKVFRR